MFLGVNVKHINIEKITVINENQEWTNTTSKDEIEDLPSALKFHPQHPAHWFHISVLSITSSPSVQPAKSSLEGLFSIKQTVRKTFLNEVFTTPFYDGTIIKNT